MAYTNNEGNILAAVDTVLRTEFVDKVPVYVTQAGRDGEPEFIEVRLVQSEPVGPLTSLASDRRYTFEILYLQRQTPENDLQEQQARLEVAARLQRVLIEARSNGTNNANWFECSLGLVEYAWKPSEDSPLIGVRINWSVTSAEVIS